MASSSLFGGKSRSSMTLLTNTRSLARSFSLIVQSMLTFFRTVSKGSRTILRGFFFATRAGKRVCEKDDRLALPPLILRSLFFDVNAPCRPET